MPANRFYCDSALEVGTTATLSGTEQHHLANVLRSKEGELIELVNGRGSLATASLLEVKRQESKALIETVARGEPSKKKLTIVQALPRLNRLELIVEKCTELGMEELWLFPGEKSEKQLITPFQKVRLERIAISAMKQSGRLFLPNILYKEHFTKWSEPLKGALYFGDLREEAPAFLALLQERGVEESIFFIGPERGFSEGEEEKLREIGAIGAKLHDNILRTDTAPIAALSVWGQL